jgi:hypothetical protein
VQRQRRRRTDAVRSTCKQIVQTLHASIGSRSSIKIS